MRRLQAAGFRCGVATAPGGLLLLGLDGSMSVSQAILVGWNSKDFARRWGSSFGVSGAGLPVHEDGSLTFPYGPQGLREGHKNSWLQTYNSTSHAWWDHKNYHPEFPDKNVRSPVPATAPTTSLHRLGFPCHVSFFPDWFT